MPSVSYEHGKRREKSSARTVIKGKAARFGRKMRFDQLEHMVQGRALGLLHRKEGGKGKGVVGDNLGASTEDDGVEADRLEKIRIGRQKVLRGLLMSNNSWINEQVVSTSATSKTRDISAPENQFGEARQNISPSKVVEARHAVISVEYGGATGLMTRPLLARGKGVGEVMSPVSGRSVEVSKSGGEGNRYVKYWQGAVAGDTALHMCVRVRDRLLIAMLLLMGADVEARNAEGITPEKAMRFNPGGGVAMRMDLLDPRIGGRGYLEGLYGRVVKPGGARVGEGDDKAVLGNDYFGRVAAAEAQLKSVIAEGTLWQEEVLMSIQRFSAYRKPPHDGVQLEIAGDVIASLCRQGGARSVRIFWWGFGDVMIVVVM
ncbi:hypothetical protein Pmar_PMAR024512 [Perkinsus marinus ATCC 50983]|uniref:Uncharacterized protein n=1 Tax=Perkinsus marinus (strain ATCC 50983 / TXsc) TaxID=423536 RepID=C5LT68_PERM5|nr:hypothetical protein Pmar_PMAR024512 [Perkinsus marinus ATCC 50983]EER00036.1 hypothetical protein Pmar_PMAR024512 [Perkinsus marinus ATCC 50983]|eukprot:XP_002767318.1 hypothetical protein Pmar_PMAR024512 [Perkinsus marinus ATCC 50983]